MSKKIYNETTQAKMLSKVLKKGSKSGVNVSGGGTPMINTTYAELKALRDNGKLVPGQQYRITDYDGDIAETDSVISARNQFDIIVIADDEKTLNENARAIQHKGDTYFNGQNLEKWELKYNIDNVGNYGKVGGKQTSVYCSAIGITATGVLTENDSTYEGLPYKISNIVIQGMNIAIYISELSDDCIGCADMLGTIVPLDDIGGISNIQVGEEISSGHGVITWMKDDKDNSMYYDFKNVKYTRYRITSYFGEEPEYDMYGLPNSGYDEEESPIIFDLEHKVFMFTFDDNGNDGSLSKITINNQFGINSLNCVFYNTTEYLFYCNSNTFGNNCYSNTFDNNYSSNTFGNNCNSNTFGNNYSSNTFGNNCNSNTFGNNYGSNTFGNDFYFNTFGNNCYSNIFGNDCDYNIFGNNCDYNIFGNNCYSNIFGNNCYSNTFGNNCSSNTFGNNYGCNTFGNYCSSNTFGNALSLMSYIRYVTLESGVHHTYINCSATTSTSRYGQNIHVNSGVHGTSDNRKTLTIDTAGNEFLTTFGSDNDTKINV